jgi:phospholipid transport system transporter-binding protein
MTKRKKATSAASRATRSGHLPGPPRAAGAPRKATPPEPVEKPSTTLALPAECMISDAASLKENLAALLDEPVAVTLDIAALQRIDTAALQVITAFVRERAGHGRAVEWQGTAPALTAAARLLGLTSLLRVPA